MENNAIMNNEVIETTEEVIENTGMSKGIKIAAGVGLSVIVGFVVYKYVAKPVIANIKTQIELKKMAAMCAVAAGGQQGSAKVLREADMLAIYQMAAER